MLIRQEIFDRHPELMELREFKTNEEIINAFKNGGTMWEVNIGCGAPSGVSSAEVVGTGICDNPSPTFNGKAVYYYISPWNKKPRESFVEDLQNSPAKAVFTSRRAAERYSNAAHYAFASDPEWQADVAREKAWWAQYDVSESDDGLLYDNEGERGEDE